MLQVPNAALRFRPTSEQIAPEFRDAVASAGEGREKPTEGQRREGQAADAGRSAGRSSLWLPAGGYVRPLAVQAGSSDGNMTEVAGEHLVEGLEVVTGSAASGQRQTGHQQSLYAELFARRQQRWRRQTAVNEIKLSGIQASWNSLN